MPSLFIYTDDNIKSETIAWYVTALFLQNAIVNQHNQAWAKKIIIYSSLKQAKWRHKTNANT